jgi:hypothetical protein
MPNIGLIDQEFNEKRYSRKHIDAYIREEILANPEMVAKINQGVALLHQWMAWVAAEGYESKQKRVAQLTGMDFELLVVDILVGIAYYQREELFTSVTAQLAGRLRFSDKTEAITTVAEIVAVLCRTDAFDILKASKMASLVVVSRIPLSVGLLDHIAHSQYLPPMVCEPRKLVSNHCSGYLTHNDSLILGNGNHHDGDICLDVLNIVNSVPLALCTDLLCQQEEEPTFDLDTPEKVEQWKYFKKQSYRFYDLIVSQGNRFWLTNKVDKRGRIYAQGYHINTQGAAFKKAMVELADEELVTGVP